MKFYLNRSQFVQETKKEIDGNDFLIAYDVPIAKTGIQQYTKEEVGDNSGIPTDFVNVYRDKSVFEDQEVLQSFDGIPIVYSHPENGKVDSYNYKQFIVGTVSGVYFKNGDLYAKKLTIFDKNAIKDILNKETNELSIGFRGKIVKRQGLHENTPYQFVEDVIHANHLALCENGKAGEKYAINSVNTKGKIMEGSEKVDISGLAKKTSSDAVAKAKPCMKNSEEEDMPEEKEELMENEESLEKKDKEDRDMMNALKTNNKKLQDIISLKNSQIRKLELENIDLENTIIEARELINEMNSHLRSRNLVNAMTAPDSMSPNHPRNAQFSQVVTSAFMIK